MFYNPLPLFVRLVLSQCPTINQWEPLQTGSSELEHISHFQSQLPGFVIPTVTQTMLLENTCMVQCAAVAELTFFVIFQQGALHWFLRTVLLSGMRIYSKYIVPFLSLIWNLGVNGI